MTENKTNHNQFRLLLWKIPAFLSTVWFGVLMGLYLVKAF